MKETLMHATILVAYEGERFYPAPDSIYTHGGHDYIMGELMHMEIRNGKAKSYMRGTDAEEIRYFEFEFTFPTSELTEDNVRQLHRPLQARV